MSKKLTLLINCLAFFLYSFVGYAAQYPERPIKILVPFNVGGGVDTYARALALQAKAIIDVPVIVVNNPGASGLVAANKVQRARANGYTLMLTSSASFLLSSLTRHANIDALHSFQHVAQLGSLNTALIVPKNSPFTTVEQLISHAKAKPETLRWAHAGRGGFHHLAGQGFLQQNHINVQDVPFKGGGPARAALLGEQIDFGFIGIQQLKGFEQQLRVLAINSKVRSALMPDIPTFAELSVPFIDISSPIVIYAPKHTPAHIVKQLSLLIKQITEQPAFERMLQQKGLPVEYADGEQVFIRLNKMLAEFSPLIDKPKGN